MKATQQGSISMPQPPVLPNRSQDTYWSVPAAQKPANLVRETVEQRSDSFSRASSALVILGLVMLGGAIAPLLSLLEASPAAKYFIGLAYLAVCCLTVCWLAGRMFAHARRRDTFVRATRIGVTMVGELALIALASASEMFSFCWEVTAVALAIVPLALRLALPRERRVAAYMPLRVNELIVMVLLATIFLSTGFSALAMPSLACYSVAFALVCAVVALRACELSQDEAPSAARSSVLLVATALFFTLLAVSYVEGCLPIAHNEYVSDTVFLASALACALLGFRFCEPSLRRTGLVIALCTIVKMTTFDTIGFDPLSKAIAYLVGALVCFAIGGMYNYAVKRLQQR